MSYHDLPDPRPMGVKFALGRMPRGVAMTLMVCLVSLSLIGVIGTCINLDHPGTSGIWGIVTIVAVLLAAQYFIAIRWVDFHKSWPKRRSYHKHRTTR